VCIHASVKHDPTTPAGSREADVGHPGTPPEELSQSFEDFYELEEAGLYRALVLITGNRHEAEELEQDAFLSIWERWDVVQGMTNPTGYLYRTAMNAFRGRLRRSKVAARRMVDPAHDRDVFELTDTRTDLARALASLTERQRAAVVLTELLQFSTGEAAQTLGVQPATIRKFVSIARASLRAKMGAADD